jgi:ribonuclease PH
MANEGLVAPEALKPPVAAISVGLVNGEERLDLCYAEDHEADVDLNVAMTADGRLIEVQGTAEGEPFARQSLDRLLDLAAEGIADLVHQQREALR